MSSFANARAFENPLFKNFFYVVLFGTLSGVLSTVGFDEMNLREIPLLICLIHIGNIWYVFVLTLFTLINLPAGIPLWAVYCVHLLPLIAAWLSFKFVVRIKLSNIVLGLSSIVITVGYYLLLLLPLVVLAIEIFTGDGKGLLESYVAFLPLSSFEIISSSLVVSFYLMQYEIRKTLVHNNKNLALVVDERTSELTSANNELLALNEELKASVDSVKELNENLEGMVRERTTKINEQLNKLSKYVYMNSHELRAPLARMLGLMQLIKHTDVPLDQKTELIDMLYESSNELDVVIKEMNRLLEREVV
jgi:signal transduction histidine kinase